MDVSHYIVYIVPVNNYFGQTGTDEKRAQFIDRRFYVQGLHIGTWNHTFAGFYVTELQSVAKYVYLLVHTGKFFAVEFFDLFVYIIPQVKTPERKIHRSAVVLTENPVYQKFRHPQHESGNP